MLSKHSFSVSYDEGLGAPRDDAEAVKWYISDPSFKGSASIKKVLPALLPTLSYNDLGIQEGESAARLWKDVTLMAAFGARFELDPLHCRKAALSP